MARLTRQQQKVFGVNASAAQIKKFGSLAAGTPANATDPEEIQSLSQYLSGWFDAVLGGNSPTIEDMNALCHLFGYQLSYLMESGIPEWNALTTYYTGNLVNVGGKIYISIEDDSLNNLVTDNEFWVRYGDIPKNCILSGRTRTTSNQPQFIEPNGAAASFIVRGLTKNLVTNINGVISSVSTDVTKSSLTLGPSTTPTCLVNDTDAADQDSTRTWGEHKEEKEAITVDTMGAEMQTFIGEYKIIKIAGVATEYALAYIKSTTELTDILRGYFTDSSGNPINRTAFFNNDTITVLSTGWAFADVDGVTIDVTYNTPVRSSVEPSSPATGDYWQDLSSEGKPWNRFDGSYSVINRAFVGVVGIDSANCVCARSFDFNAKYEEANTIEIGIKSTAIAEIKNNNAKINVCGKEFEFGRETWSMVDDLGISADMYNATEQASTKYFGYVSDGGEKVFLDTPPYWRPDLFGWYHPHNPFRCAFVIVNDSGSDFVASDNYFMHQKFNPLKNHVNTNTARIANNGTSTITSQSSPLNPAIASVNRTGAGVTVVTYAVGYYGVIPSVVATVTSSAHRWISIGTVSITGFTVTTQNDSGTDLDLDFDLVLTRQDTDYKEDKE